MHMKQQDLLRGKFDEQDLAKMPEIILDHHKVNRLELKDSIALYLETTSGKRKLLPNRYQRR